MKKTIYLLYLFTIALLLLPKLVLAEDYPTEGVHYFLTYPNGEEVITTDYEKVTNPEEKLIYEGKTNASGEVILDGLTAEGQLRIVQEIPEGYSSDKREITFDLSGNNQNVQFVDFKTANSSNNPISNPETGQSLLFIVILGMVLLVAWKTFKKETPKKTLYLLPILVLGAFAFKVYASDNKVVIKVQDKEGKILSDVTVKVYAYPSRIQAAPAVKFDANGGTFFDGTKEMYIKIPHSCSGTCDIDQFVQSLSPEEEKYIYDNIIGAYRDGYRVNDSERIEYPDQFINGAVINVKWEEDESARLITIDGNGGYYNYYDKKLPSIIGYDFSIYNFASEFQKENEYNIGIDEASTCSNYYANGILPRGKDIYIDADIAYVCWNHKPDGLYVNDVLFLGNLETCYDQSNSYITINSSRFQFNNYEFSFTNLTDTSVQYSLLKKNNANSIGSPLPSTGSNNNSLNQIKRSPVVDPNKFTEYEVEKLEIVIDGRVIVSLTAADLELVEDSEGENNGEKQNTLLTYLGELSSSCGK